MIAREPLSWLKLMRVNGGVIVILRAWCYVLQQSDTPGVGPGYDSR